MKVYYHIYAGLICSVVCISLHFLLCMNFLLYILCFSDRKLASFNRQRHEAFITIYFPSVISSWGVLCMKMYNVYDILIRIKLFTVNGNNIQGFNIIPNIRLSILKSSQYNNKFNPIKTTSRTTLIMMNKWWIIRCSTLHVSLPLYNHLNVGSLLATGSDSKCKME